MVTFIVYLYSLIIDLLSICYFSSSLLISLGFFYCFVAADVTCLSIWLLCFVWANAGRDSTRTEKKKEYHSIDHNAWNGDRRTIRFPILYVLLSRCQLAR